MSARDDVLAVLSGGVVQGYPCFSGLINVTAAGLAEVGYTLPEVHTDGSKMAAAAATSHRLFGLGSVVVPLDMCVEAEILGAMIDFGVPDEYRFPRVDQPLASSTATLTGGVPEDLANRGRMAAVVEAIGILQDEEGAEAAIGAGIPGPFTLAMMLVEFSTLLREMRSDPEAVGAALDRLTDLLAATAAVYSAAGADFVTVHEMGGSPGFIGLEPFEDLVLPRLQHLLADIPGPRVLSVCGHTDHAVELLRQAGADGVSVDQLNDLAASRVALGDGRLFGNIDPVAVLGDGTEAEVRAAVAAAIDAGADAVWPGCDLYPGMPPENLIAMVEEAARHRRSDHPNEGVES